MQSPSSAGSRGLAKTMQFTNNKTQMQLGQEAIAESMVEIRNIMNRIDGVNVPVSEAESDYLYLRGKEIDQGSIMYKMEDYSDGIFELQSAKYADGTELDEKELEELESTQELIDWVMIDFVSESAVPEDAEDDRIEKAMKNMQPSAVTGYYEIKAFWEEHTQGLGKSDDEVMHMIYEWTWDEIGYSGSQERDELAKRTSAIVVDALKNNKDDMTFDDMIAQLKSKGESAVEEDSGELARLKELSGIEEDTNDDLMQWAKKYSQYKNLEDDNLIEALYDFAFDLGITQFIFEVGELQAAEQKLGKKQEDWEDAEINAAMEMSPISNGLIDDLHRILPGNAELEQKLDSIRGQLEKAGLKEDKYQPMPEGDEFDIAEDEDFEEVLGSLGFPEDETELFDAEYQGRKVPLNKPMRGDVKKFKVYVKDPSSGNVKKVNFGHGGTSAKRPTNENQEIKSKSKEEFQSTSQLCESRTKDQSKILVM